MSNSFLYCEENINDFRYVIYKDYTRTWRQKGKETEQNFACKQRSGAPQKSVIIKCKERPGGFFLFLQRLRISKY